MITEKKTLFITGVTGTLGKEFIREILLKTPHRLYVLIRRQGRFTHWDRLRKILAPYGLQRYLGTRLQVLEGDVTLPEFGLCEEDIFRLRREVDEFFHVAALTALNGSKDECEKINVGGTRHALEIAWDLKKSGKLTRFFYFSTAYVAGSRQTHCSLEDALPEKPAHANFYESSKYAAETLVRGAMKLGLPATIFRPSIVVGDSKTGEVSEFNVIYPFLKLFAHGILKSIPTRLDNSFNIVPIDFVTKAAWMISQQASSLGKAFHLVTLNPPSIGSLLLVKQKEYPQMPVIEVVAPESFDLNQLDAVSRGVHQMLEPYLGYLNDDLTFDARNTVEALKDSGIEMPKTDHEFLRVILRYAVDAGYLVVDGVKPAAVATYDSFA